MKNTPGALAAAVRRGVGLFPLRRGLVEVTGGDRRRWLNGMISADVARLEPGPRQAGCYALLRAPKRRILADLQVLEKGDRFWLETGAAQGADLLARLERYVIADDVELKDESSAIARFGVEGPRATALLEAVAGAPLGLAPYACTELEIAGRPVTVAAFGWSGESALQLFVPSEVATAVESALVVAGGDDLVRGADATLEVLRIEAGIPRVGAELDEEVFPAEAGLIARAVSLTKGCFTGQEIVARLESRGHVNHRLVGLRFDGDAPPEVGSTLALEKGGKALGEVTSVCRSELGGVIGLGFARLPHDLPGTALFAGPVAARVAALPLVGDLARAVDGGSLAIEGPPKS